MLAKQPEQRYPTPERAAQALQMFLMADSQAPPTEEPPQMRKYLTWLETAPAEPETLPPGPAPSAPPNAAAPAAQDVAKLPIAKPAANSVRSSRPTPVPGARSSERKKHRKHRRHARVPIAQPAYPAGPQEFDVELVPLPGAGPPAPPQSPQGQKSFGLTGREWLLMGVGAAALTIAVIVGVVIALMVR
jgi:hypothetical protein